MYVINKDNTLVLCADDTSIIVIGMNKLDFEINLNLILKDNDSWFNANLLTLNFNKSQYVEFHSMNYYSITAKIVYGQINVPNVRETIFLGLIIDDILIWKQHNDHVINTISRSGCAVRNIKHFVTSDKNKQTNKLSF
jgi:hypothetical protein